jgi:hypothetical protein
MSQGVLEFTRPNDKSKVYLVREHMVRWYRDDSGIGTHIDMVNGGMQVVHEAVDVVTRMYYAEAT